MSQKSTYQKIAPSARTVALVKRVAKMAHRSYAFVLERPDR